MPCYMWTVHWKKLGNPPLFMIPVPHGMQYSDLISIINDYAYLTEETPLRLVDQLVSVTAQSSLGRVLKDRERIEGPTQKAVDEEVYVQWGFRRRCPEWAFTVDPFGWGTVPVPQRLSLRVSFYEWVVYVVEHPEDDPADGRHCMIVQAGTTIKQLKMLVGLRMGDQIEHVYWKDTQGSQLCVEKEVVQFTGAEKSSLKEMETAMPTSPHYVLMSRLYGVRYRAGVFPGEKFHQSLRHSLMEVENEMGTADKSQTGSSPLRRSFSVDDVTTSLLSDETVHSD